MYFYFFHHEFAAYLEKIKAICVCLIYDLNNKKETCIIMKAYINTVFN